MFFFFNDTATTEIYTLSLHDALPIYIWLPMAFTDSGRWDIHQIRPSAASVKTWSRRNVRRDSSASSSALVLSSARSEEHTSELQSRQYLVCRLLLVKKYYCYFCLLLS